MLKKQRGIPRRESLTTFHPISGRESLRNIIRTCIADYVRHMTT